jgi:putative methyltransferase (TIGR04325 family)
MVAEQTFHIWEGVYGEWNEALPVGDAFNNDKWLSDQAAHVGAEIASLAENGIAACAVSRDYVLPLVAAFALQAGRPPRILDFGGGMASSYPLVMGAVPGSENIEFHVLESPGICNRGRAEFSGRDNLIFHSEMPPADMCFDIVHAGRSMQYVDDWRGLLAAFAQRKARYIALAGLLAGDIKSFVTMQNYYGCKIPVRFLNRDDVIRTIEDLGYRLIYKALHFSKRLGKEGPLPMDNFPVENRLEHPCQLLFQKKAS